MIYEIAILCGGVIIALAIGYMLFMLWLYQQKSAVREILENSNWTEEQIEEALQTDNLDAIRNVIYNGQQDPAARTRQDLPEDEDDFGEQGE